MLYHDQIISEMDPLERALRLGEDREAVKEKEDPRCVAGGMDWDEGSHIVLKSWRPCVLKPCERESINFNSTPPFHFQDLPWAM